MYEHKSEKLAPPRIYRQRIRTNAFIAFLALSFSLIIGIIGYKITVPEFDYYDSLLNYQDMVIVMIHFIHQRYHLKQLGLI